MKRTKWYTIDIKPVREGWYEVSTKQKYPIKNYYWWTGKGWKSHPVGNWVYMFYALHQWRGLTEKVK